ncbi:hypothetical protein [Magnetovibrio sp.]|uniref:hypothetical protein n=1 Tax=Magnetovibrio sp. TaxID=2024836 RepID=UPI002F94B9DE
MFKKIAIGLGVIIVAIAVGVYYLSQNAGKIVESVIEEQGTRATQVAVALDAVDISLTDLKAGLRGLTVANPAGFKTDRAISLGEISVKIAKDWSPDVIVIDEVMVNAPEVTYEIGSGGSNIAAIQKNVENFMKVMSGPEKAGSAAPSEPAEAGKEGPKIVINNFYFKNGKVNVSASLMQGKTLTTPLPDIHLKDIGKDEGGASPAEVVNQLIAAITDKAGGAASSLDLSQLGLADISGKAAEIGKAAQDAAEGALKGATDKLGGAGAGVGDAVGEKLGGAAEGIGGAVKGLFGN